MSTTRRLKIWERHGGVCCLCDLPIDGVRDKWIVEHIVPLGLGGADDDTNTAPAHERCRRVKDRQDVPQIAKMKRQRARHLGIKKPSKWRKPPEGWRKNWATGRMEKVQ